MAANGNENTIPAAGKVKQVRQEWLVHEDGALASKLQNKEYDKKYGWNRQDRQTARQDVPLARVVSTEEERRAQQERFEHLQMQRALSAEDEQLAKDLHGQELSAIDTLARRAEEDQAAARRVHEKEMARINNAMAEQMKRAAEDAVIASQFQTEEAISDLEERRLLADQELARKLQAQEKRKYVLKMRERELKKERRRLENEQAMQSAEVLGSESAGQETSPDEASQGSRGLTQDMAGLQANHDKDGRRVRVDGKLEDLGDFSDFYIQPTGPMDVSEIKELQEIQDEELARIIQDQEFKRGAQVSKNRLRQIEARDAELAKVMQQQEQLRLKKHQQHRKERKMSSPQERSGESHSPNRTGSMPVHYQHQNRHDNTHVSHSPRSHSASSNSRSHTEARSLSQDSDRHPPPGSYALYQTRPLPETPAGALQPNPEWESSLERALNNKDPSDTPSSPAPPGYRDPPSYPSHGDSSPLRLPQTGSHGTDSSGNVFAAIDPTAREVASPRHQSSRSVEPPSGQPSPPLHTHHAGEDGYADLDDMGPIPGMRRSGKRGGKGEGGKKGSCKQQ